MKKLWLVLWMLPVLLGLSTCAVEKIRPDYDALLLDAAAAADVEQGRAIAAERNAQILRGVLREQRVDFDDLLLLARLLDAEAGDRRYSDDYRLCVGEVALNRVASPEFPDSLREVVEQYGQYPSAQEPEFADLRPKRSCAALALRLLKGERRLSPAVLYRSTRKIGTAFVRFYDRQEGYTYFCESVYSDLYK